VNWHENGRSPPSLITVLLSVILNVGVVNDETQLFDSAEDQRRIHIMIVVVMVCCIPTMLLMKPVMRWRQ